MNVLNLTNIVTINIIGFGSLIGLQVAVTLLIISQLITVLF